MNKTYSLIGLLLALLLVAACAPAAESDVASQVRDNAGVDVLVYASPL